MRKILTVNIVICLAFFLAGCNREYYVDKDTISSIYDEVRANKSEVTDDEGYDDEQSRYLFDGASAGSNYIYFTSGRTNYVVDTNNMTYRNMCDVVGCDHTGKSCEDSIDKNSIRYHKNGIYYLNGSSLYYRSDSGEVEKVFTNDFSTEWTKKMDPENPKLLLGMIFIDEHTLLMSGRNYYIKYDLATGERSNAVVVPEGNILSFCYSDGVIYSSYDSCKVVRTVWDTGESEQVSEYASHVRLVNDRIWYAKYSPLGSTIYSNDLSFTDEKLEIENTEVMFDVFDDAIIYTEAYDIYYLYNQYGEPRELFKIEDLTYSYDKLPPEYPYDNGVTEFQASRISFLNYNQGEVYFEVEYLIDYGGGNKVFITFYKVDKDGNITELRNENEIYRGV